MLRFVRIAVLNPRLFDLFSFDEHMNIHDRSDHDLIDLIVREDMQAFEVLYERYAGKVLRRCYFICLSSDQARDLMQEIWIKVFLHLRSFKKESTFQTWLYRLTTNHCLNYLKSRSRADQLLQKIETKESVPSEDVHSVEVKDILATIPFEDRELLTMKFIAGYTYEEVASICGMSVSAVKMKVSRLLGRLRKAVES